MSHDAEYEPGRNLGPYEIVRELGRGGMGRVYLAKDTAVGGRLVAIKLILEDGGKASEEARLRFQREIKNLARLRHPNIVSIFTAGTHEGRPYFVMDYVAGRDFSRYLDELTASSEAERLRKIVRAAAKTARAVHYAHTKEIVHRDLKPANLLVATENDEPMILDFGIAKYVGDTSLTQGRDSPGTPLYRAPEQIDVELKLRDELIDVWALGVILYRALAGTHPFKGDDFVSLCASIMLGAPAPPRSVNAKIPVALERIVLDCLQKDPAKRVAGADVLADRLDAFLADPQAFARAPETVAATQAATVAPTLPATPPRRSKSLVVAALLVVAVGGAVAAALKFGGGDSPQNPDGGPRPAGGAPRSDGDSRPAPPAEAARGDRETDRANHRADERTTDADKAGADKAGEAAATPRAPFLVLRGADNKSIADGATVEIDGPEAFTLTADDDGPLGASSLTAEGFAVVSDESTPTGRRWNLRPAEALVEARGALRVKDASGAVATLTATLHARVPRPLATLVAIDGRPATDAASLVVRGWEADVEARSEAVRTFPSGWTLRLVGASADVVVEAPLKPSAGSLVGRVVVPESLRDEATRWTPEVVLADRAGARRTASFTTRVSFDGRGPTIAFERVSDGSRIPAGSDAVAVASAAEIRVRVEDRNGPIKTDVAVDGAATADGGRSLASGDATALPDGLAGGRRAIAVTATDAAGNRTTAAVNLDIKATEAVKPAAPLLEWAEVLEAKPDPKVVVDDDFRARIAATGLPWRVRDRASRLELLLIPAGNYVRGSNLDYLMDVEDDYSDDVDVEENLALAIARAEGPAHRVALTKPFYLARRTVSNAEYRRFKSTHDSGYVNGRPLNGDDQPAVNVTWSNAVSYCTKFGLRLPTEAEWEYACRAGTTGLRYGDLDEIGWYSGNAGGVTQPGGRKKANALGLYDMIGNVYQWCSDGFAPDAYLALAAGAVDPKGPPAALTRVARGGSFASTGVEARAAYRWANSAIMTPHEDVGFRPARAAEP